MKAARPSSMSSQFSISHQDKLRTVKRLMLFAVSYFVAIILSNNLQAQNAELEKRNGFKDLKLGTVIDSLQGVKFKKDFNENDEFPAKLYTIENPNYAKIGEVTVEKIEVKTYKDLVYEIIVLVDKDERMMKALESIYGQSDYDLKRETYFWKSTNLILKFKSHSKNKIELSYVSYVIKKQMKADKNQKVDDIANDF